MKRVCASKNVRPVQAEVLVGWGDMIQASRCEIKILVQRVRALRKVERFATARLAAGVEFPIAFPKCPTSAGEER